MPVIPILGADSDSHKTPTIQHPVKVTSGGTKGSSGPPATAVPAASLLG